LLVVATAVLWLTGPGRRSVRRLALWLDSHVEGFSERDARIYKCVFTPVLRFLYLRVVDDVASEVAGCGGEGREDRQSGDDGRGPEILDLGCGPGDLAEMLAVRLPRARIVGLDLSTSMIELARSKDARGGRLRFEVGDASSLPFETGSFDFVVSTLSLHHWADPAAGFAEISRVLRPGGMAAVYDLRLLTVPAEDVPVMARRAGLELSRLRRNGLKTGPGSRLFVRFTLNGRSEETATDASPSAQAAGHARIPAAVTPGEVA
jgi:SAM-dependent methyltransferase